MEYLNNVLSSGEVSNLFARDELDEITGELVPVMKKQYPRRPPTQENLYDYFISRARNNLHVVLCFSPVSWGTLTNSSGKVEQNGGIVWSACQMYVNVQRYSIFSHGHLYMYFVSNNLFAIRSKPYCLCFMLCIVYLFDNCMPAT